MFARLLLLLSGGGGIVQEDIKDLWVSGQAESLVVYVFTMVHIGLLASKNSNLKQMFPLLYVCVVIVWSSYTLRVFSLHVYLTFCISLR